MARVPIPLSGQDYRHATQRLSSQISQNWYLEANPGSRDQFVMRPSPGLALFSELEGADRGMHRFNEELFAVNGTSLYEIAVDGTTINHGTVLGEGRCIMADDGTRLIIVTGGPAYIYTVADGLQVIDDEDLVNPTSVGYLNGQFIFDNNAGVSGEFVTSSLLTTDFDVDPLDFAVAEAHPDDIVRVLTWQQNVWFFGNRTLELWYNSGVGRPPFDRMQSGVRPYGLIGRHAVVATDAAVYWLDEKRTPRRSTGGQVQNIGNPALGNALAEYSTLSDCIAMTWQQEHQTFIAFTFPTENATWVFHEPTETWFRWAYGTDGSRARPSSIVHAEGINLAADHSNGKVYKLDPCAGTDDGEVIQRKRITTPIHSGLYDAPGQKMWFDTVEWLFTWDPCVTEVEELRIDPGTGVTVPRGICGITSDLAGLGELLAPTAMWKLTAVGNFPSAENFATGDSNYACFTAAFSTDILPGEGNTSGFEELRLLTYYSLDIGETGNILRVGMDTSGFIQIKGYNAAKTEILNMTLKNGGGSFADGNSHVIAVVVDLSADDQYEVWIDNTKESPGTNLTITTYTVGEEFGWACGGSPRVSMNTEGGDASTGLAFTESATITDPMGETGENRGQAYISFDNSCTLIPRAIWDANGWVRNPALHFQNWYIERPLFAFGASPLLNDGTASASPPKFINDWDSDLYWGTADESLEPWEYTQAALINGDIGGTVDATEPEENTLPTEPTTTPVEIVSPYYNKTGDFFNLSDFTVQTFAAVFGGPETNDYESAVTNTPTAISYSLTATGQRVGIVDDNYASASKIWLVDSDGDVISSSNSSIELTPSSTNLIIVASDTGTINLRKFSQGETSVVDILASFNQFWGEEQTLTGTQAISETAVFSSSLVAVPVYKKAGRVLRTTYQVRSTPIPGETNNGLDPVLNFAFATQAGAWQATDANVIDAVASPTAGDSVFLRDEAEGWYWLNFKVNDFFDGAAFVLNFVEVDG